MKKCQITMNSCRAENPAKHFQTAYIVSIKDWLTKLFKDGEVVAVVDNGIGGVVCGYDRVVGGTSIITSN